LSVNELANKVVMLHMGKVIFDGSAKELNSSNDKYIKYFILGKNKGA
jgi:ABC-type transporter Mla maintaining outer membrane lipid asymmetry ATPase subunit MlaF